MNAFKFFLWVTAICLWFAAFIAHSWAAGIAAFAWTCIAVSSTRYPKIGEPKCR
jgi:hypothetical protein